MKWGENGGSMTSTESYYGFIYIIFGLGSSHMGLQRGPEEKACLARAHGLEPAALQLRPLRFQHVCTWSTVGLFLTPMQPYITL